MDTAKSRIRSIFSSSNIIAAFYFFILSLSFSVLFLGSWAYPFNWTKAVLFRTAVLLLFLYWIAFQRSSALLRAKKVFVPFMLLLTFILLSLVSVLFSASIPFSLWGTPLRGDGIVNLLSYFLFGILSFLILKRSDWKKLLNFSIIIGFLVSLVAVFQNFSIFSDFLMPVSFRPSSTTGNPNFLSNYILLLFFACLSFLVASKSAGQKMLYLFFLSFFSFVIVFITQTRSAMLGIFFGLISFFVFYPKLGNKLRFKIILAFLVILSGMFLLNANFSRVFSSQPLMVQSGLGRMLSLTEDPSNTIKSRISAWKVSLEALKERPVFGFGPENFEIAFNKYYDSSLPEIGGSSMNIRPVPQWWDKAHNFLFDISVASGIPALIAFLAFFALLAFNLQKIKKERSEASIFANSMQAAFVAYLVSLLFSFPSFDDYAVLFFLIGFSFHLLPGGEEGKEFRFKPAAALPAAVLLLLFIYFFSIKPLYANYRVNLMLNEFVVGDAQKAIDMAGSMNGNYGIMGDYVRENRSEITGKYAGYVGDPKEGSDLLRSSITMLQGSILSEPNRLRYWLLAGESVNSLIERKSRINGNYFSSKESLALKGEGNYYFENAARLSPKRQEVYKEWAKLGIIARDYDLADDKAQKCISLNPLFGECYFLKAIASGYKGEKESLDNYLGLAKANSYDVESESALPVIINMHMQKKNYAEAVKICKDFLLKAETDEIKIQIYRVLESAYMKMNDYYNSKEAGKRAKELEGQEALY